MTLSDAANGAAPSVMLIIGSLRAGGAERQLSDMANYWARSGAKVTLVTWSDPQERDFYVLMPEIKRIWLGEPTPPHPRYTQARELVHRVALLRRLLRDLKPAVLLSFIDVSNIHAILAAWGLPLRVVVAERTHPAINRTVGLPWRVLRRLLYSRAYRVVAQTHDAAGWLERSCRARVAVIPNSLRDLPQIDGAREPLVVAIGRLSKEKGVDVLLRAFGRIRSEFPHWRVCVIGDGAERSALTHLCDQLGLARASDVRRRRTAD